ncbi:IS3 family transposase [Schaalia hyovaginalis]|nr:IS3 family transposase [Schaalia hyovaginalis]
MLKGQIRRIYEENYEAFGARKMHVMLNRSEAGAHHGAGHVARCTVERFMRAMSISGIRRAKSPNTTRSTPKDQCPMDRVNRHFAALAPNILWVADITYVKTHAGWVIRRVRPRRLLASDPGVADLHQLVHRPRPRRVENGDLASTPRRRRPNRPHSPFGSGRPVHRDPLRASPCRLRRRLLGRLQGRLLRQRARRGTQLVVSSRTGPKQGPLELHRRPGDRDGPMGPLVQHHPPSFRDQHAHPRRTRERSHPTPARTDQTPHPQKAAATTR